MGTIKREFLWTHNVSCHECFAVCNRRNPGRREKPTIVFIMGDDIGWFNIGAYHRGIMAGKPQS